MATDYEALRNENLRRYGTDIGRIGPMLLANRYDDRSHFLFELLQNAEDALKRRNSPGPNSVHFSLSQQRLRFSHHGQLFTPDDIKGICGIGESTKEEDLTAIGKFGIGFKAVYAFTDAPEIHSGDEHFAIDSFVRPRKLPSSEGQEGETVFEFPFRDIDVDAHREISLALQKLGVRTLLFLHLIDEISWSITDGRSGAYLREDAQILGDSIRRVVLVGQDSSSLETAEETWLVCSKEVTRRSGQSAGHVEIAFRLSEGMIVPVPESALVVYFPTIVPTYVGFLIQGPYRTTPSRDNVPKQDKWNQYLIEETSELLIESLHRLKDMNLLTVDALRTLPLDAAKFIDASMFQPLFSDIRAVLTSEPLLPKFGGGHTSGDAAKLAYTQDVRELLSAEQLGQLFGNDTDLFWLDEDITPDRTPELRQYLIHELEISEVRPEAIVSRLDKNFLESQTDVWVLSLYEFLQGQPGLLRRLSEVPLVRLKDGTHVVAKHKGQLQAFLPAEIETGFPTVRTAVCTTSIARKFLESLGLTEPDAVDDVERNVLPKYQGDKITVSNEEYDSDIRRIVSAFATDSTAQRTRLVEALTRYIFVRAVKPADSSKWFTRPGNVYLATERLKTLLSGIPGVLLVDDTYSSLRGEQMRELLEACGAVRYLKPLADNSLSWQEQRTLREKAGHAGTSGYKDQLTDWSLVGLEQLLQKLQELDIEQRRIRAKLLWEELINLEDRRGKGVFTAEYTWSHYGSYRTTYDSEFVRRLRTTAWVPNNEGNLERPEFVLFESLGWNTNPFLQSKIRFKPPVIEALAREAGIEPGVLDLLKKLGLHSEVELKARLGISEDLLEDELSSEDELAEMTPDEAIQSLLGDVPPPTPPHEEEQSQVPFSGNGGGQSAGHGGTGGGREGHTTRGGGSSGGKTGSGHLSGQSIGTGTKSGSSDNAPLAFISYVATHPEDEEPDPDGLTHTARMALEEQAIKIVLKAEPNLQRTETNNPGFDLVELNDDEDPCRWVEVKAMKGTLQNRPVGLSKTQFECAQRNQESFWLYIVEQVDTQGQARIIRIQNPAGKASTFTFDRGWISVSEINAHD